MSSVKISALPAATSIGSSDIFPIVQSGTTKKGIISQLVRPPQVIVDAAGGGDYTTIAAAVAAGSTDISVKAGTYTLASRLIISTAGTRIRGSGDGTIIQVPLDAEAISITAADCVIENLQIDGRYSSQATGGTGIDITAPRFRMRNVYLHDVFGGHAVLVNANDVTIEDCRITSLGTASSKVQASPAPSTTVFHVAPGMAAKFATGQSIRIGSQTGTISAIESRTSYVGSVTSTSVFALNAGDVAAKGFTDGQVIRIGLQSGTILNVSSDTITLTGALSSKPTPGEIVSIDKITLGSAITAPSSGDIVGPVGAALKGIFVTSSDPAAPIARCNIINNYISGWSQAVGIWYYVNDCLVSGNTILDNYGYESTAHSGTRSAIEVFPSTSKGGNNRLVNNVVDGSTHNCFEVAQGEVGSLISGNIIRNWAEDVGLADGTAIEITGQSNSTPGENQNVLILGNNITSNGANASHGINLVAVYSGLKIEGNAFAGFSNGSNCVYVNDGAAPQVIGNSFAYCGTLVKVNSANAAYGQIIGNHTDHLNNAGGVAIRLDVSGDGWVIQGNVINDTSTPLSNGILIVSGNKHRIIGNVVRTQFASLKMTNTSDNVVLGNHLEEGTSGDAGGVFMNGTCARNIIKFNTLKGGGASGPYDVTITGTADYNIAQENLCLNNVAANIFGGSVGTHNITEPNNSSTIAKPSTLKPLTGKTVNSTQTTIAHGLGYAPTIIVPQMTSAGTVWRSATSDATNVYLTADLDGRTTDIYVR